MDHRTPARTPPPPGPDAARALPDPPSERHVPVDAVTRRIANPLLGLAIRLGWGVRGTRILTVTGRRSGLDRHHIVIPIEVDGIRFLVAPRGRTDWVRNLQSAGRGRLRLGRRREEIVAAEVDDADKVPVLREYLAANRALVSGILGDLDAESPPEDLAAAAEGVPVFRIR